MRELWRLALAGRSGQYVAAYGREVLKLRTPVYGMNGGELISRSGVYRLLHDPFYTGRMVRAGDVHDGTHQAMITEAEYEQVQKTIARHRTLRQTRTFLYRGLIACGRCDAQVTARTLTNRYGTKYVYYHCARKEKRYGFCPEPAVQEVVIARAVREYLGNLLPPASWRDELEDLVEQLERIRRIGLERVLLELAWLADVRTLPFPTTREKLHPILNRVAERVVLTDQEVIVEPRAPFDLIQRWSSMRTPERWLRRAAASNRLFQE